MRRTVALLLALAASGSALAGPKEAVHDAFAKLLAAKSFRATVTDVAKGEQVSSMEFVAPNRYRVHSTQGPETTIIGDDAWMNVGGRTTKVPIPVGKIIAQFRSQQTLQQLESGMVVTDAGSDSVDGEPAHAYTYKVTDPFAADVKLWIGDKTGLPLQIESKGSFMGHAATTRVRYRDFNDASISVAAPQG
jgi:outer membrane lipoprotein-sorting protein